ncbi:MAG: hypothetical protein EAZ92_09265 [Candidatus Kapaibacterium sp.]|nr:MAG: hypothetical protein EAZ92_09265 [Candidatus Kapabacteria bacterium]
MFAQFPFLQLTSTLHQRSIMQLFLPTHFSKATLCVICTMFLLAEARTSLLLSQPKKKLVPKMLSVQGVSVTKMDVLNSPQKEVNLSLTPNGRFLYFMSERGGQSWSQFDDAANRSDGDIYVSERVKGEWTKPQALDESINTGSGEDEPNITSDGQNVYYQSFRTGWESLAGPYFMAEFHGKKWDAPVGLGGTVTSFIREQMNEFGGMIATDGSSWSPSGNLFMFTLGKDRKLPMDIYYARRAIDGSFSAVEKLDVSTPKNERSIFIAPDGKTIYFSSNGYGGLGGLDMFKATLNDDGTVSALYNLGDAFNTKGDEYGFIISPDGKEAYFVRDGDIHRADLASAEARELKPLPMIIFSGKVLSKTTQAPLESSIDVSEVPATGGDDASAAPSPNAYSLSVRSNSVTGEFTALLKPNKKYVLSASASKHKGANREFALNSSNTLEGEYILNIELDPVPPRPPKVKTATNATLAGNAGKAIMPTIQPTLFETDEFTIEEKYLDELDKAWDFLKANPSYQAEISGFADDRGSYEYNLRLSQRRVNAVLDYLWSLGCERKRLALKFFGEEEPIAANASETGRSKNRRVEISFFRKLEDAPIPPATKQLPPKTSSSAAPQTVPAKQGTANQGTVKQGTAPSSSALPPVALPKATSATASQKNAVPLNASNKGASTSATLVPAAKNAVPKSTGVASPKPPQN